MLTRITSKPDSGRCRLPVDSLAGEPLYLAASSVFLLRMSEQVYRRADIIARLTFGLPFHLCGLTTPPAIQSYGSIQISCGAVSTELRDAIFATAGDSIAGAKKYLSGGTLLLKEAKPHGS